LTATVLAGNYLCRTVFDALQLWSHPNNLLQIPIIVDEETMTNFVARHATGNPGIQRVHRSAVGTDGSKGLKPLIPTLPGAGEMPDQAQQDQFPAVVGVVGRATVVRIVFST
jgi:hypothetical protein